MTSNFVRPSPSLLADLLLAAFLAGLVVVARVMPHAWDFTPVVATALFAGMVLRSKGLAPAVPIVAMLLSDLVVGFHDWRMMVVVYAALVLPAALGLWGRKHRAVVVLLPLALSSSLLFFAVTNLAVWAFSGMYTHDLGGLAQCYVLALPFLRDTLTGDVLWSVALFGAWWLAQRAALIATPPARGVLSPATPPKRGVLSPATPPKRGAPAA